MLHCHFTYLQPSAKLRKQFVGGTFTINLELNFIVLGNCYMFLFKTSHNNNFILCCFIIQLRCAMNIVFGGIASG